MTEDHKTYQRATQASVAGLAVSILITAALGILALWSGHPALSAATWHALPAIVLWACLWIVYQQHRLERIEALEAEQIAQRHGTDSSIFETTADDLSVARRRLDWLYRWIVPLVSVGSAVYLIGLGLVMMRGASAETARPATPENVGILLAFCAGIALVGFLMSRYFAGMARIRQWQLLRSGSAYLMGIVLVAAGLVATLALAYFDFETPLAFMPVIVPVVMIVIGIEIALNFVLDFYRPRRPGEMPRPAFDSRLLSLLTAPESIAKTINEAINYQFGFEITRSWFWQLLSRAFGWLVLFAVAVLLLVSCFVIVGPNQQAVVTRFGRLTAVGLEPGLHFKLPWPISKAHYYNVTGIRQVTVGSEVELKDNVAAILWTGEHAEGGAEPLIVAPPRSVGSQRLVGGGTPSNSLMNAEVLVYYRVNPDKLLQYIRNNITVDDGDADNDHARVRQVAEQVVAGYVLRHDIDEWIGTARVTAGTELAGLIQQATDEAELGVEILDVAMTGVHPPQEVAEKFHEVVAAEQDKLTAIQTARQEATKTLVEVAGSTDVAQRILNEINKLESLHQSNGSADAVAEQMHEVEQLVRDAGGTAAVRIAQARADRWTLENRERGKAAMFIPQLAAYKQAPRLYQASAFLEALAENLEKPRKIVVVGDHGDLTIRGDFKDVPDPLGGAFEQMDATNQ